MIRRLSAQLALLFFAAAIIAGISAGNSPATILSRALAALLASYFLAQFVGWSAKQVLRDYLVRRKLEIDREHLAKSQPAAGAGDATVSAEAG